MFWQPATLIKGGGGFVPLFFWLIVVYLTTRVPDTSDTSVIRERHEQHECTTSETRATRVWHRCEKSAIWVLHKRHDCDTSAIRTTRVRHKWESLILITTPVKTYFDTPILAIWQIKGYKGWKSFIIRTTFWKYLVLMPKCIWKVHHKSWTMYGKNYIRKLHTRL